MQTSNFWNYMGEGRIAISRGIPRNVVTGYQVYRPLNPGAWFKDPDVQGREVVFRARYFQEILAPLNARRVYDHLHRMVEGHEPVLLCWERDPTQPDQWCHRRMVAEWFAQELGVAVPEYVPIKKVKDTGQGELF